MASAVAVRLGDAAWRQAHEELVRLATERAGLDFEEGRWLLRAHRAGAHLRLGYASFHEYAERLFGYGPRLTQEKLRVAEALFATFRDAMAKIRRDAGESLDDDAAILLLCRQVLEGPRDPGRSSYQIALTVCESCRRAKQQGRGELIEVGPEVLEMAECDGQHIGHVGAHGDAHAGASDDANAHAHVGASDDVNARAQVARPVLEVIKAPSGTRALAPPQMRMRVLSQRETWDSPGTALARA